MPFSIWDYLRQRTKDSVLAGIQDAMDVVEQGDTNGSQHAAVNQLTTRLGTPEAKQLPSASINGRAETTDARRAAQAPTKTPSEAPERPVDPSSFDDELERRIDAAATQNGPEALPPGRITNRPRRGRPPKNSR